MTKTPEELAVDYALNILETRILDSIEREEARLGFLAGYQAAKEQFADTSKVMPDTCEHILDMEKMVDVSSSATLNNWISVRTRLPDRNTNVLAWIKCGTSEYVFIETASGDPNTCSGWKHYNKDQITYWMPLPEPPEDK